jgi:cytochrome c oxidase subunit 2
MSPAKAIVLASGILSLAVAFPAIASRAVSASPRRVDVQVQGMTDGIKAWHFSPGVIRAQYGDTIHVHFEAVGAGHGFRVQGRNVDLTAYPGLPQEAVFVADWVGGKEFYCTFDCGPGHAQMTGMILVRR